MTKFQKYVLQLLIAILERVMSPEQDAYFKSPDRRDLIREVERFIEK